MTLVAGLTLSDHHGDLASLSPDRENRR
jgi:hypothetical protein